MLVTKPVRTILYNFNLNQVFEEGRCISLQLSALWEHHKSVKAPAVGWSRQFPTEGLEFFIAPFLGWCHQPSARYHQRYPAYEL